MTGFDFWMWPHQLDEHKIYNKGNDEAINGLGRY